MSLGSRLDRLNKPCVPLHLYDNQAILALLRRFVRSANTVGYAQGGLSLTLVPPSLAVCPRRPFGAVPPRCPNSKGARRGRRAWLWYDRGRRAERLGSA